MPGILFGKLFTGKYMSEVSIAGCAGDFSPPAVSINAAGNPPWDLIVKARPSAAGVKLCLGPVEGDGALPASIDALFKIIPILTSKWVLCPLVYYDMLLFRAQLFILHKYFSFLLRTY